MNQLKVTAITSFLESPYHKNRAPYNEQLFEELAVRLDLNIIRPIAWTDIIRFKLKRDKKQDIRTKWRNIPIKYPILLIIPRFGLRVNWFIYFLTLLIPYMQQRHKPDLFYTTWAYPDAFATMVLARFLKKPYIVTVHGSDINDLAQRKQLRKKILRVLSRASLVISPSEALKSKMVRLGVPASKIKVTYTGVNPERFAPLDRLVSGKKLNLPDCKRILYIGYFKVAKGAIDIVKASQLLAARGVEFELILIGSGECEKQIRDEIKTYRLEKIVNVVGPVEHSKLRDWINASDCVCLPSYAEGVPNVLLEAMACETNIVATRVGGIPEVTTCPEALVLPGDINALADRLEEVINTNEFITTPSIDLVSYSRIADEFVVDVETALKEYVTT